MSSNTQSGDPAQPRSVETQAYGLWSYLVQNRPQFSLATARAVAEHLNVAHNADVKELAPALRKALSSYNVALKHHAALEAAARMLGHDNFHSARRNAPPKPRLRFERFTALTGLSTTRYEVVLWRDLVEPVRKVFAECVFWRR